MWAYENVKCFKKAPNMLWLSRWTSLSWQNGVKSACASVCGVCPCIFVCEFLWHFITGVIGLKYLLKSTQEGSKLGQDVAPKNSFRSFMPIELMIKQLEYKVCVCECVCCWTSDLPLCYCAQQPLCWLVTDLMTVEWHHHHSGLLHSHTDGHTPRILSHTILCITLSSLWSVIMCVSVNLVSCTH